MYAHFSELPDSSRIWIYQANRDLNDTELKKIEDILVNFVSRWQSHGAELTASFKIMYQRFIILAVDTTTNLPSGCSIDSSVAVLREIQEVFKVDLFDRMQIPFLEEGNQIFTVPFKEIPSAIASGKIQPQTITFNNTIDTKEKLNSDWLVTAEGSWLKRHFAKIAESN